MVEVRLSDAEWFQGILVGVIRNMKAKQEKKFDNARNKAEGWGNHIHGACAEMAYAKATSQYWAYTNGTYKTPDVGKVMVKHCLKIDGELKFCPRRNDDPNLRYMLVVGEPPLMYIVGSLMGYECLEKGIEKDPGNLNQPAIFVEQKYLNPFSQ